MVILIGAESLTGKTLMAQTLLERYKIPYLSADHLKMGLYRANPNCGFAPGDHNERIEEHLWPILKGIIDTVLENRQHIIIEGCYIFPRRLKEFSEARRQQIIPVFMGFSRAYLERNFAQVLRYRNSIETRQATEERSLQWFIEANERMKNRCQESGTLYFEIDAEYQRDTETIYDWIDEQVRKLS